MHLLAIPRLNKERDDASLCLEGLQAATTMVGDDPDFQRFLVPPGTTFQEVMPAFVAAKVVTIAAAEAAAAAAAAAQGNGVQVVIDLNTDNSVEGFNGATGDAKNVLKGKKVESEEEEEEEDDA